MFEIGATLREARERRQLTYEQVEAEIKIRAKYLRALEEEEFDSPPVGHVRARVPARLRELPRPRRAPVRRRVRLALRHAPRRRALPPPPRAPDDAAPRVVERRARRADRGRRDRRAVLRRLALRARRGRHAVADVHRHARRTRPRRGATPTTRSSPPTTTTVVDDAAARARAQPVTLRVDIDPATAATWVKITRLSTAKAIAQKVVAAGGHLGGGALYDDYGFAIETRHPGQRLAGRQRPRASRSPGKGPWLVTADADGPHVVPGKRIPPAQATEGK